MVLKPHQAPHAPPLSLWTRKVRGVGIPCDMKAQVWGLKSETHCACASGRNNSTQLGSCLAFLSARKQHRALGTSFSTIGRGGRNEDTPSVKAR